MAADTESSVMYLLELKLQHKDFLASIRHWDNLKVATEESSIWVKDFTAAQLENPALRSVPFAKLFSVKNNLLFPLGSLLPARKMPALLWTPIERALPVKLSDFNHNLFTIPPAAPLRLIPSDEEQQASILVTGMAAAGLYIDTAPAARLQRLQWTVVNNTDVFLKGQPLLPLDGNAYWQQGRFIFPLGWAPEFTILQNTAAQVMDPSGECFIWWLNAQEYCLLHAAALQPLSIASWRQTLQRSTNN
jgi:MoxR-vWA-beta-propeller ternary system domain bpX2